MDKKMIKSFITLITYTALLILILINIKPILQETINIFGLLRPLFIGFVVAFILNKPYMFIRNIIYKKLFKGKNKSLSSVLAIMATFLLVIVIVVILINIIIPKLIENLKIFWSNSDIYLNNIQNLSNNVAEFLKIKSVDMSSIGNWILNYMDKIESSATLIFSVVTNIISNIISYIITFVISSIFSIYLLAGKDRLLSQSKKFLNTYLPENVYDKGLYVYHITVDTFNRYILGQTTDAVILGTICFIGMSIFRLDYPLLISVLIGIMDFIPVVGSIIGGIFAFLLLIMVSPSKAVWFVIFLAILVQFEGNVVYPRVVGRTLGLPGIWILLSVTVGMGIGGPIGIIIGVPAATVIYKLIRNDMNMRIINRNNK